MTSMVDRTLPDKSGKAGAGQGTFREDGSVPKPVVPPKKPEPKKADSKAGQKKGTPPKVGKSAAPDPKAAKEKDTAKIFQNAAKPLAALKDKGPLTHADLNQELAKIKKQVSGITFDVQAKGGKWVVTPKAGGRMGKGVTLDAKLAGKNDKVDDDKASAAVKAKVGRELSNKPVKNSDEEKSLIAAVYDRYSPEGLKGIRFQPSTQQPGIIDVIVSASLAEKVAQLDMRKPGGLKELGRITSKMKFYAGRTTIYVFYGKDRRQFGTPITQKHEQAGHAEFFLKQKFPALLERIRLQQKTFITPLKEPIPIHLDINRTPCDGCATSHIQDMVNAARSTYGDVPFSLTISSASISQGAQPTTEKGLIALMSQGIELTSSTVWNEIKKQMMVNKIKQFEYGQQVFDIDDINEFIARAAEVQDLIDKAVLEMNKSKPSTVVKGTGVPTNR
jgi:hypothetical protein